MTRRLIPGLLAALLCACAGSPEEPTIASLKGREVKLDEVELSRTKRTEVIMNYREFLNIAEQGEMYSEAMRRLADLEMETGLDLSLSDEQAATAAGRRQIEAAIKLYQAYLNTYTGKSYNDLILYQMAKAYELLGKPDQALSALDQLISRFPHTRYRTEVQFRRGETLFVLRRYAAAEKAYASIIKEDPDSVYYEKSLYKYGWTLFKQDKYQQSLSAFMMLLDRKQLQGKLDAIGPAEHLTRADRELVEDTLRVTSLAFSNLQGEESIRNFFKQNGERPYEPAIYRALGSQYLAKNRITDAADVFLGYAKRHPDSPLAPRFHTDAINAYKKGNLGTLVLSAKEDFVKRYGVSSHHWQLQTAEARTKIRPLLMEHIRELATHYHAVARKSRKASDYQAAAKWYNTFITSFPKDPQAAQMNFLLAEVLYDGGQYPRAVEEFEKTSYYYPPHAKSVEAGYAALLAYKAMEKKLQAKDRRQWQERTVTSALKFSGAYPQDKRVPAVLTKTAEQLYAMQDYPRAAETAKRLLALQNVDPKLRKTAWTVLGHAQFELEAYDQAEIAYVNVLRMTSRKDKQYTAISDRLAASIYKQGEQARSKGDNKLAAQHFLRVGQVVPTSPLRATAQYDAAVAYITMKSWQQASTVLENFRRSYPKNHKLQSGVTEKLAVVYMKTGQRTKAAREMETLVRKAKDPAYRQEMLWQVAGLYEEGNMNQEAVRIYKSYIKQFPRPLERAIEARHKLAEHYRKSNQAKEWGHWLQEIIKTDARGGKERTARTSYLAADATLILAKPTHTAYQRARLTTPLKTSLKKKKKLMKKALKAYQRAIDYKVAEITTAASYQIAEIYNDFARALMKSQRPKGLSGEEREQYDILLEEQAYPFEEKAIDIHSANFQQTRQGIFDKWVKASLKVLRKLQPIRYDKQEKSTISYESIN